MKIVRIAIHGLFLGMVNFFAILAGFGLYALFRPAGQLAVQLPTAVILSVVVYSLWSQWLPHMRWPEILLHNQGEYAWVFAAALLVTPLIFYPLHYLTQGYVARFNNVLAIWAFQVPVNALALFLAWKTRPVREGGKNDLRAS